MSTKTVINVKTDKDLKNKAQKLAKNLGLPLGTVINAYLREFVRERRIVFSEPSISKARKFEADGIKTHLASESSLAKDWLSLVEQKAWKNL